MLFIFIFKNIFNEQILSILTLRLRFLIPSSLRLFLSSRLVSRNPPLMLLGGEPCFLSLKVSKSLINLVTLILDSYHYTATGYLSFCVKVFRLCDLFFIGKDLNIIKSLFFEFHRYGVF